MPTLDGLLIIHKPTGPTSHDVVAQARRALGTPKVGHTGTLDPAASGVLGLVVGRATRLAQFLTAADKEYVATVRFGVTTDTYDAAGTITSESGVVPERRAIETALRAFVGTFEQTPPAYSAKKIDGVRAYALARRQEAVLPKPATVTAHELALVSVDGPCAQIRIVSSAGFYVRSLAHDLGARLGTGARLDGLVRTRVGHFTLEQAVSYDRLDARHRDALVSHLMPLEALVAHLPSVDLSETGVQRIRHGQDIDPTDPVMASVSSVTLAADTAVTALFGPDRRLVAVATRGKMPGFLHASVVLQ